MILSLIHPSRGRPWLALENYNNWIGKASGANQVEHLLSLDKNDPSLPEYLELFSGITNVIVNENHSVVEATNHVARYASGEIIIYLSDDFDCPLQWDSELIKMIPDNDEYLIWVNDNIQGKNTVLTIPIMSRGLYTALGYFWHPGYLSMWVDVDLWHVCKKRGALVEAHHLKFEHKHYSVGKAAYDNTYKEHDNPKRQEQGWNFFRQRQAQNFMTKGIVR